MAIVDRDNLISLPPRPQRCYIQRLPIDRMTMNQSVVWAMQHIREHRREHIREQPRKSASVTPLLITGPNAHLVTLAAGNPRFARALRAAHLSVPDGISVVLASRLLGAPVPERVPGGELMERLCAECAHTGVSVFFLGGLPGAADLAARNLARRYPALQVAGTYCPPRGFENDPSESAKIRRIVTAASPGLLCVAFGAPRQEIWMHEHCPTLPIGAAIAVGAALDTQGGLRKRAPAWTHGLGIEWLYRMLREPLRLGPRYLTSNPHFIFLVLRQWCGALWHAPAPGSTRAASRLLSFEAAPQPTHQEQDRVSY
jgi:N-acetylglucosaminyldiphosphoundecaprenol N-acetyl-beta-D-mannosaminyltransferase